MTCDFQSLNKKIFVYNRLKYGWSLLQGVDVQEKNSNRFKKKSPSTRINIPNALVIKSPIWLKINKIK